MPTHYTGRVTLILAIVLGFLWAIFPSAPKVVLTPFQSDVEYSFRPNLRPGIDMVGGTSLLYEIRPPEGGYTSDLADRVMASLKRRVDPDGVRNLIWRPQGNTRLEIQMPLRPGSERARSIRDAFAEAQRELEATNIRLGEVLAVIEHTSGDERRQSLETLAMGSDRRAEIFGALASTWDQIQQARDRQDIREEARLELEYDGLREQLLDTNLAANQLQTILELRPQTREQRLSELRERFADFDLRLQAMDEFIARYDTYRPVKDLIDDAATLKAQLRGAGVLEFYIVAIPPPGTPRFEADVSSDDYQVMVDRLMRRGPTVQGGDRFRWFLVDRPDEYDLPKVEYNDHFYALVHSTADKSLTQRPGQPEWALASASNVMEDGARKVGFRFDAAGSLLFSRLTGSHVGRPMSIVLDGRIYSAPNINQQISGQGVIEGGGPGGFSVAEQDYLIRTLDAGSLPATLTEEPISERTVGPQLGRDNLRAGFIACILGLIFVAIFMVMYYYIAGLVATTALLLNVVLILGAMAALNATFTLPSVAAIVLTIGMSVDANVLIYERLREEQLRGLSLRMALRNAYDRAFSAIVDANVTTGITSLILYWFGSEEVRGFGLTLMIGLITSMFTALFVTKTIFGILIDKFGVQNLNSLPLTFPRWDRLLRPNIDWVGKAWMFALFSVVFIALGMIAFSVRWAQGRMLDIEFASGTAVQFELIEPMPIQELRQLIEAVSREHPDVLPAPSVVTVGDDQRTYEVVTPSENARAVRAVILDALQDRLNVTPEIHFELSDRPIEVALDQTVVPIEEETKLISGMAPQALRSHIGGVAIVLRNMDPPIPAEQIRQRVENERLQPRAGGAEPLPYRTMDVEVSADGKTALILSSDPNLMFDRSEEAYALQWQAELAGPLWDLVRSALTKPAELQKVNNFDPQIAGEARSDAVIALALSIVAIMAYIWLRFGNLQYGAATVVALVHDTVFVLAAIGLAHYVAESAIGQALLIEAFRINLTMVAAVLTVIGYSMNDTVVVFDRIRENRGKFGHVNRQVINDSVNQTLSRTLLTGGSTLMTVTVMYILGGPGIHGFTFALLVGILCGTYSSIAIASPLLLIGRKEQRAAERRGTSVREGQLQRA